MWYLLYEYLDGKFPSTNRANNGTTPHVLCEIVFCDSLAHCYTLSLLECIVHLHSRSRTLSVSSWQLTYKQSLLCAKRHELYTQKTQSLHPMPMLLACAESLYDRYNNDLLATITCVLPKHLFNGPPWFVCSCQRHTETLTWNLIFTLIRFFFSKISKIVYIHISPLFIYSKW